MVVARKRYGSKSTKKDLHVSSMPSNGRADRQRESRREGAIPNRGAEKWAAKDNGPVGASYLGLNRDNLGLDKPISLKSGQRSVSNSSPAAQPIKKLVSLVKGKKIIARGTSLKAKPSDAVNPLSESFAANINSLFFDHASSTSREKDGFIESTFEFTAPPLVGSELHGEHGRDLSVDPVKVGMPITQSKGDEGVAFRSCPDVSEGLDRDGVGVAGMELEDEVGMPSPV